MTQMTALRAHRRGGPEVLTVESVPIPVPAAGEVLVAVHAAAITFDELIWDETWTQDGVSRTPIILSHEISGVVTEIASGVTDFEPGDNVYGLIGFDRDGGAADYVTVPAYDVVIDTVGGDTLDRSFGVLRRGGRLITLSEPPAAEKADEYGVNATFFIVTQNREQLAQLAALVDADQLQFEIAATFALARGREAFESGQRAVRRPGKTVIVVRE
jgi:NADPH:quinone reductase-like Zn-dependent oxidoreductase